MRPKGIPHRHYTLILGLYRDNGKENGNYKEYRGYIGLYRDNGKEIGNYKEYRGYIGLYRVYNREKFLLCRLFVGKAMTERQR